jgi:hypothetical protein
VTGEWRRPEPAHEPAVEVPLTGDGPLAVAAASPPPGDDVPPPPNWRKLVGIAAVIGVVSGVALAIVLLAFVWNDGATDDTGGGPTTALDDRGVAPVITTPPTLSPLETLPSPDRAPSTTRGPAGTTETSGFDVTLPTFPEIADASAVAVDGFDLSAAVIAMDVDRAVRSETRVELGAGGYSLDVTIVRDPNTDRYAVTFENSAQTQRAIVDVASGLTYVTTDDAAWFTIDNGDIVSGTDTTDVREFFRRMMIGPVRSDTLGAASVEPGAIVQLDDTTIARRFDAELPGAAIPEWQLYVFSPVTEFSPGDRAESMSYSLYVDPAGDLRRVVGASVVGGVPQLVDHRVDVLPVRIVLDLPDPATVTTGSG